MSELLIGIVLLMTGIILGVVLGAALYLYFLSKDKNVVTLKPEDMVVKSDVFKLLMENASRATKFRLSKMAEDKLGESRADKQENEIDI